MYSSPRGPPRTMGHPLRSHRTPRKVAVHLGPRIARPFFYAASKRTAVAMLPEVIGWLSSAILLATLLRQVHTQWRERSTQGVSRWLFRGQFTASCGFLIYSLLLRN